MHYLQQLGRGVGFGKEYGVLWQRPGAVIQLRAVPAGVNDLQRGLQRAQVVRQLQPVHASRHLDIGEEKIDAALMIIPDLHRLQSIGGFQDFVATFAQ